MSSIESDISQSVVTLVQDTDSLHEFLHGSDTQTVLTESGAIPTVSKLIKDLRIEISSITTDSAMSEASARASALDAANQAESARQYAEAIQNLAGGIEGISEAVIQIAGFLPASATAPATRTDGSALQVGDRYFNTSINSEYIHTVGGWVNNSFSEIDGGFY